MRRIFCQPYLAAKFTCGSWPRLSSALGSGNGVVQEWRPVGIRLLKGYLSILCVPVHRSLDSALRIQFDWLRVEPMALVTLVHFWLLPRPLYSSQIYLDIASPSPSETR